MDLVFKNGKGKAYIKVILMIIKWKDGVYFIIQTEIYIKALLIIILLKVKENITMEMN